MLLCLLGGLQWVRPFCRLLGPFFRGLFGLFWVKRDVLEFFSCLCLGLGVDGLEGAGKIVGAGGGVEGRRQYGLIKSTHNFKLYHPLRSYTKNHNKYCYNQIPTNNQSDVHLQMPGNLLVTRGTAPILYHRLHTHLAIIHMITRHTHIILHPTITNTALWFLLLRPKQQLVLQQLQILLYFIFEGLE